MYSVVHKNIRQIQTSPVPHLSRALYPALYTPQIPHASQHPLLHVSPKVFRSDDRKCGLWDWQERRNNPLGYGFPVLSKGRMNGNNHAVNVFKCASGNANVPSGKISTSQERKIVTPESVMFFSHKYSFRFLHNFNNLLFSMVSQTRIMVAYPDIFVPQIAPRFLIILQTNLPPDHATAQIVIR